MRLIESKDIEDYIDLVTEELKLIKPILDQDNEIRELISKNYQKLVVDNYEKYVLNNSEEDIGDEERSKVYDELSDFLLFIRDIRNKK